MVLHTIRRIRAIRRRRPADRSVVDHTASQGAVAYDASANLLYTINAGSDTITVFAVHGDQLTRLQVISSGGRFPVSITTHGSLVYVLNARGGGSISGFVRVGRTLVATVDAAASADGKFLYVENGAGGVIRTFSIGQDGTLTKLGNATLPGGAGAEGMVATR